MDFQLFFEYIQLQSYRNLLHFQHSHLILSNKLLLIHTHQDLLYMSNALF